MGFNNRTCSTALYPRFTSGPVLRGPHEHMMWREWMVRVINTTEEGAMVSLQAFVHPDLEDKAKCLGYVSSLYGNPQYEDLCVSPPYGTGLYLNGTQDDSEENSQFWTIRSVDGQEGTFEIIASNKPEVCARLVGVESCRSQVVLVENIGTSSSKSKKYTSWKFERRYDILSEESPSQSSPQPPNLLPASEKIASYSGASYFWTKFNRLRRNQSCL